MAKQNFTWLLLAALGVFIILMIFQPNLFKSGSSSSSKTKSSRDQKRVLSSSARKSASKSSKARKQAVKISDKEEEVKGVASPWDDMLTTKDLLPSTNDGWKQYGCDTFVPKTDDLLSSAASPSRVTAMFPNSTKSSHNWDLRGSIQVPIDSSVRGSMLLAKPDGYGLPYEDRRSIDIVS